jgi:type II secretory pathway pseudopilin PulG
VKIRRFQIRSESGYMLLAMMLMVTVMMIGLALEAPRIGQQIRRAKEEELIHRGNEYKSAIRKYFRKFGQYPVSIEQLENTNNMRFLRKRFKDPFTGKDDWHLLHPGEVLVNPANAGAAPALGQSAANAFGQSSSPIASAPTPAASPSPSPGSDPGASGTTPGAGTAGITPAGNLPGVSGNSPVIGGGPVVGVASTSKLKSIKEINGKDHYNDWQFVYDPRLEVQSTAIGGSVPGTNPVGGTNAGQPGIPGPGANSQQGLGNMGQPSTTNPPTGPPQQM